RTIEFQAGPGGQLVLEALEALRAIEGRKKIGTDEVPTGGLRPRWRRLIGSAGGQLNRRAYTFAVLEALRGRATGRGLVHARQRPLERSQGQAAHRLGLALRPPAAVSDPRLVRASLGGAGRSWRSAGGSVPADRGASGGQHRAGVGRRQREA